MFGGNEWDVCCRWQIGSRERSENKFKLKTLLLKNKTVRGDSRIFVGKVAVFFPCVELENKIELKSSLLSVGAHVNRCRNASRGQVSWAKHSCDTDAVAWPPSR